MKAGYTCAIVATACESIGNSQGRRLLFQITRIARIGHRGVGGLRRTTTPPHSRRLGLPRSAGYDHGTEVYVALSRETLQVWLPCLSEPRRSGRTLEAREAGEIGVQHTEGWMMDREASVSVQEDHHPCLHGLRPAVDVRLRSTVLLGGCHVELLSIGWD